MRKSKKRTLMLLICTLLLCIFGTMSVQAATVKKVCEYKSQKVTFKKDVTGDGKTDTVVFTPTRDKYGQWIKKIKVSINGKKVLTLNTTGYDFSVNYIQLSKNKNFLQIYTHGDSSYVPQNFIYRVDKKGTKLTKVLELSDAIVRSGAIYARGVVSAAGNTIKVAYDTQPGETGWVSWNYSYKYSGNKFKRTSSTASVKSMLTYDRGDGYTALFRKNQFKACKSIKFYKNTNLSSVSFTAKKNDILKMKKIKVTDKALYIQFQKGNKTGWQIVKKKLGWFYGVTNRLAG